MALPLIFALFKSEGVFYASAYMAIFNLFSWTHGYISMSGKSDKKSLQKAFFSPVVISVVIGLILFFCNIKLPSVIATSVSAMASLNTPLAMIVTGVSLAQSNIKEAFSTARCYYIVFLMNIVVPVVALLCYSFLPIDQNIVIVNLISTACPCAVTTLLFATKFNREPAYASNLLTLSNVTCIATIPLIILLHNLITSLI
ncbi:MAG: AEC family transporter, partial [Oscillospiraceae bacterium]